MIKFPFGALVLKVPGNDKSDWKWIVITVGSFRSSRHVWRFTFVFPHWIVRKQALRHLLF
jgi:hypothetical protein